MRPVGKGWLCGIAPPSSPFDGKLGPRLPKRAQDVDESFASGTEAHEHWKASDLSGLWSCVSHRHSKAWRRRAKGKVLGKDHNFEFDGQTPTSAGTPSLHPPEVALHRAPVVFRLNSWFTSSGGM